MALRLANSRFRLSDAGKTGLVDFKELTLYFQKNPNRFRKASWKLPHYEVWQTRNQTRHVCYLVKGSLVVGYIDYALTTMALKYILLDRSVQGLGIGLKICTQLIKTYGHLNSSNALTPGGCHMFYQLANKHDEYIKMGGKLLPIAGWTKWRNFIIPTVETKGVVRSIEGLGASIEIR